MLTQHPHAPSAAFLQVVLTLLGVLVVAATYESYPKLFKGARALLLAVASRFHLRSKQTIIIPLLHPIPPPAGVPAPGPPPAHDSRLHVFAAEFAVTLSVLFVGGLAGRFAGRVPGAFLGSVFYWVVAYAEAGAYSGAIMNPASILALHVYRDLDKKEAWAAALPKVAPYAAGSAAAAVLLGLVNRAAAGAGGRQQAAGGKPAMSAAAAERRRRATKAE